MNENAAKWSFKEKTKAALGFAKTKMFFWRRKEPRKPKTWVQELKDWVVAFVFAAVVYFVLLPAVLGTSAPLVVVSSCSEKGFLQMGDVLVLQGVRMEDVRAPLVEIDKLEGMRPIFTGSEVTGLDISGHTVELNRSNDIVVYISNPYGVQIIHRAFAKVKTPNDYFLITKGDANQIPDQMVRINSTHYAFCIDQNPNGACNSAAIRQNMLVGRQALFGIPLFGHVKLFFCDLTFNKICEGHANIGTGGQYTLWC